MIVNFANVINNIHVIVYVNYIYQINFKKRHWINIFEIIM
jgi:hypothetical protein